MQQPKESGELLPMGDFEWCLDDESMNAPDSSRRFKLFSGFNATAVCASLKCEQRVKNLLKQPSMPSNSQKIELVQKDFTFKYQNIVGRDELRLYVVTTAETSKEK
jgi:hypothetical protein